MAEQCRLEFIRYGKSGFAQPGILNEWRENIVYKEQDYVYDRFNNHFYESMIDNNIGVCPWVEDNPSVWRKVIEKNPEDGLKTPIIEFTMTRGDCTITPRWKCLGTQKLP
jgi:hypothetical protein